MTRKNRHWAITSAEQTLHCAHVQPGPGAVIFRTLARAAHDGQVLEPGFYGLDKVFQPADLPVAHHHPARSRAHGSSEKPAVANLRGGLAGFEGLQYPVGALEGL